MNTDTWQIVTRPDFDGVVCAVLLKDGFSTNPAVRWVEPGQIQKGEVAIDRWDILANLPFDPRCGLWFDHHITNKPDAPFSGHFSVSPSAARVISDYFDAPFQRKWNDLVAAADKIDAADLTEQEVLQPASNPYVLLSLTISGRVAEDEPYWNRLVDLLGHRSMDDVMADSEIQKRCQAVEAQNQHYAEMLRAHTRMQANISITDFRPLHPPPDGNRFLSYCIFPESIANVKIRYADSQRQRVIVSVGRSIFNRGCRVNVGLMLSHFEGGGHRGAGGCSFHADRSNDYLPQIIQTLVANEPNER